MIIAELRGSIVTIRAEVLQDVYFEEIMYAKKHQNKTLAQVLIDGDIGLEYSDFSNMCNNRGIIMDKNNQLILTAYDKDDYYEDGYSFYRSSIKEINVLKHSYIEFGTINDHFLITFEYQFGLFKHYHIDSNMEIFNSKMLAINTTTFLSKPVIKSISDLRYSNKKLESRNDYGFEIKSVFAAIVKPKKSLVFNKMIYKDYIDKDFVKINHNKKGI
jgi:hypothetical protein|tara:strand:- start:76 stop:723 length:648 start_codon:yes stop_codon:yes gene_type:complete